MFSSLAVTSTKAFKLWQKFLFAGNNCFPRITHARRDNASISEAGKAIHCGGVCQIAFVDFVKNHENHENSLSKRLKKIVESNLLNIFPLISVAPWAIRKNLTFATKKHFLVAIYLPHFLLSCSSLLILGSWFIIQFLCETPITSAALEKKQNSLLISAISQHLENDSWTRKNFQGFNLSSSMRWAQTYVFPFSSIRKKVLPSIIQQGLTNPQLLEIRNKIDTRELFPEVKRAIKMRVS